MQYSLRIVTNDNPPFEKDFQPEETPYMPFQVGDSIYLGEPNSDSIATIKEILHRITPNLHHITLKTELPKSKKWVQHH